MTKLLLNLQQKDNYPIETQVKDTKKKLIEGKMQKSVNMLRYLTSLGIKEMQDKTVSLHVHLGQRNHRSGLVELRYLCQESSFKGSLGFLVYLLPASPWSSSLSQGSCQVILFKGDGLGETGLPVEGTGALPIPLHHSIQVPPKLCLSKLEAQV